MSFLDADRGQSIQIGAVLLFGALVILFAVYQAFIIPNQNRAVEFNHNQNVERDMVDVRNAILESYTTGQDGYASVQLGTEFPPRLVGINPAPPGGSLYSTDRRPMVVEEGGSDVTNEVCPPLGNHTRFLEYSPSYSVYGGAGTIRYENSVIYHDFGEQSVQLSGQRLVTNDTVRLLALQTSMNLGGSRTVPVEPVAGTLDTSEVSDPTVTVPTALDEDIWEALLEGQVPAADVSVSDAGAYRNLTLTLDGTLTVECGPVGIGQTPPGGPRQPGDGGGDDDINPAAPGDIRLVDEALQSNDEVVVQFNNTGSATNFTAARINFYEAQGGNAPGNAEIRESGGIVVQTLPIRGDFQEFTQPITLSGDGALTTIVLDFDQSVNPNDWFVISFELESGETAQYFVPAG